MKSKFIQWAIIIVAIVLSGCVTNPTRHANELSVVKRGTITGVRNVQLAGETTGAGVAIGSTIGAAAGINLGGGWKTALVGALVGQVVGAVAGHAAEKHLAQADGVDLTIRLDDGQEVSVTQHRDDFVRAGLLIGDRVRVITTGRATTVDRG